MAIQIIDNDSEIYERVQRVLGVPEELLDEDSVISPEYKNKAERYILKKIASILDKITENDKEYVKIAYIYYIASLICKTMDVRLPHSMKDTSTETILQQIDWKLKSEEMLALCDDELDDLLSEYSDEELEVGNTMIDLSNIASYPNSLA